MRRHYGIILLDNAEIVFRVYVADNYTWKLLHFHSATIYELDVSSYKEILIQYFTTEHALHIAEWKVCSRMIPQSIVNQIAKTIGYPIESISPLREQELLCKGMFSELW